MFKFSWGADELGPYLSVIGAIRALHLLVVLPGEQTPFPLVLLFSSLILSLLLRSYRQALEAQDSQGQALSRSLSFGRRRPTHGGESRFPRQQARQNDLGLSIRPQDHPSLSLHRHHCLRWNHRLSISRTVHVGDDAHSFRRSVSASICRPVSTQC